MAEAPRYRPLGVSPSSMPAIDFVSAGRAQARVYDQLNRGLDSMFKFATEKATAQAKIDAAQFAFENPITAEQLQIAVSEGRDISEIVGDQTTVFGGVTAASYATQLSTELNKELTKKISAYDAQIAAGLFVDPDAMQTDLTAMIAGHGDLVAQIDPSAGLKYNASANASASVVYKAALEHKLKMGQAVLKDGANAMVDALPNTIKSIFASHKGDFLTTMGLVANELQKTDDAIIATGDYAFIQSGRESLRNVVEQQQINVLTDIAMKSDEAMSAALTMGNFGSDHTDLFLNLDDDGKAKVREAIRTRRDAKINDDKVTRTLNVEQAQQDAQTLFVTMERSEYQGNDYNSAVTQLQRIAMAYPEAVTQSMITSLDNALDPTKTETPNYVGEFEIRRRILSGELQTPEDIMSAASSLNVSAKQMVQVLPLLETKRKEVESIVDKSARSFSKIVPGSDPTRDQSAAYYNFLRQVDQRHEANIAEWQAGGEVGPRPLRSNVSKNLELELRQSVEQTNLDKEVAFLTQRFGPDGTTPLNITITEYTTEAEIRQALIDAGYTGNKLDDLMRPVAGMIYKIKEARNKRDALND